MKKNSVFAAGPMAAPSTVAESLVLAPDTAQPSVASVSSSGDPLRDGNAAWSWRRRWLGSWTYWGFQIAGWGGLVVMTLVASFVFAGKIAGDDLQIRLVKSAMGLVVTHLFRVWLQLVRERWNGWRLILMAALGLVLAALAMSGPLFVIHMARFTAAGRVLSAWAVYCDVLYWQFPELLAWVALYFAFTNYRSYRRGVEEQLRLEAAVKDAELRVLKAQINPHFLFNCLNSTWAMIPRELERPRESLTLLADLLRAALTLGEKKTVPFRQEWETVQTYLALERIRFEERMRVRSAIDPAVDEWPVPPFLLQTLVENAVKFGVRPRDEGGEIGIEAFVRGATLHFRVTNAGRIAASTESTGVGLKNSRARLRHLFGVRAVLTLTQAAEDSVVAEVSIPAASIPSEPGRSP